MSPVAITAIATVLVAFISAGLSGLFLVKRNNISGAREVVEAALLLVDPQTDRISQLIVSVDKMSVTVDLLKRKIGGLELHIDSLTRQVISLGHTPIPMEE